MKIHVNTFITQILIRNTWCYILYNPCKLSPVLWVKFTSDGLRDSFEAGYRGADAVEFLILLADNQLRAKNQLLYTLFHVKINQQTERNSNRTQSSHIL